MFRARTTHFHDRPGRLAPWRLVLNALLAWWWADPLAALIIVVYGSREGMAAWSKTRSALG
jgi:hypothetical protein